MIDSKGRDPQAPKIPPLFYNWLSLAGLYIAVASLFASLLLIGWDYFAGFRNEYMGILTYVIAPGVFWFGVLLVGTGMLLERRRRRKLGTGLIFQYPRIDLSIPRHRRLSALVTIIALVLLLLTGFGSYRSFELTESVQFCGAICHKVMQPEFTAYSNSPHARVECTKCHIGPGATWFVKSKISGLYQVYATLAQKYSRPIPVPVENLRPAQDTCEQCHWPAKFYGASERTVRRFLTDPQNSPWTIRMLLKVGGADPTYGPVGGIHWHVGASNRIDYIAKDDQRQVIPWVRVTDREGHITEYRSDEEHLSPQEMVGSGMRRMDCLDCHNRPTHLFRSPYDALDFSLWLNRIDRAIPSIKANAATALVESFKNASSEADGVQKVAEKLRQVYADTLGDQRIEKAILETQNIFRENFFPWMKTTWEVRPDNIGHMMWPGCFRCHDGHHVTADGKKISHKCDDCHTIIAQGAGTNLESVSARGLPFDHPGGELPDDVKCNDCHTGKP